MNDPRPVRRESQSLGRRTLRHPAELAAAGMADADRLATLEEVAGRYAVAITPDMVELIDRRDASDPIARQFVPDAAELTISPEEMPDPIGDDVHEAVEGLVHRYPDRVLLKYTSVCAVYCRFCFRRETVGHDGGGVLADAALERAFAYIEAHPQIWEIIVSGGDPLVVAPRRIARLTASVAAIDHVKVVRFHTRVPVVSPERVTDELVEALLASGKTTWVAIHANHPRELTDPARYALTRLADAGIPLIGQSVLLHGVNDDPDTLEQLMRAFVEARVKPYYLHHGDLAPGTGHFRTSIGEGQALMRALRNRASGLCQPAYMLDLPGGHGKVPVGPSYVASEGDEGAMEILDAKGVGHAYSDG